MSEPDVIQELLDYLDWGKEKSDLIESLAIELVEQTRRRKPKSAQLESFLQEFSLNTQEGKAMMCLAEALLRIPDIRTVNALMKDKVAAANWLKKQGTSSDWITKVTGFGMVVTKKTLDSSLARLGEPVIREAMIKAMKMMGRQFVLGTDISIACINARDWRKQGYRISYDMLGEAARDKKTADIYFNSYKNAIEEVAQNNNDDDQGKKSGISVKLSALHPRYEYSQKERCIPEITEKLQILALLAAKYDLPLTIDAEEANRLNLSIEIFQNILSNEKLKGWNGFGLAVQAYQKRALPLIEYLANYVRNAERKIQIRLVKGAYWDSEIKHAQMGGFLEYPVFTRKENTDLSYLACAQKLFEHSDVIYPMFATHNAHTICAVKYMADQLGADYEFQRLHGMGEGVYASLFDGQDNINASIYAPVGEHKDLLPYLVRRLLENGANSSFVNKLMNKEILPKDIVRDPVDPACKFEDKRHPKIPLPKDIFGERRVNSAGIDLDDYESSKEVLDFISNYEIGGKPYSIVGGNKYEMVDDKFIEWSFDNACQAYKDWNFKSVHQRAIVIERFADLLEIHKDELMAILVYEGGKTIADALGEVREAVDFCRYYASIGREVFDTKGTLLPGYTGEENRLIMQGRGVFVCISPWNFPLAIFTGQVIAAVIAGNAVIAKPASQTSYIATRVVELMHQAGIPGAVVQLLIGNGEFASRILEHKNVSGVAFTGSTDTAKMIQQTLVVHNDAIVPFIAETGGQNAMIVDSSALLEQVVDDVISSAFGSAGQRCSALRALYVQNDIADDFIELLAGAIGEINIGKPNNLSTDIGYIVDVSAKEALDNYKDYISSHGRLVAEANINSSLTDNDRIFAPVAYEINSIHVLDGEVFGPILHILRFHADQLGFVINQINRSGYGLTFGLHSRIEVRQDKVAKMVKAGNIYINRSMIGAVVGVQPFGGMGLSGTGPKAGGPNYLHGFATEKVISTDITASGGNASLLTLDD